MHRAFAAQEHDVPMPTLYATPLSANGRKVLAVSRQVELEVPGHEDPMTIQENPSASKMPSQELIGTWELVSREGRNEVGEKRDEPMLGSDPIAILIYDGSGHFSAQFMKRDRNRSEPESHGASTPNNSRAVGGYDAYFGTYTVDDTQGAVTQCLVGALSRENVGQVLTRAMIVVEDELTIRVHTRNAAGETITRTLRWQRVG
jgi:hypothetical protein